MLSAKKLPGMWWSPEGPARDVPGQTLVQQGRGRGFNSEESWEELHVFNSAAGRKAETECHFPTGETAVNVMARRCLPSLDPDSTPGEELRLTLDDRSTPVINVGHLPQFGPFANVL